MKSISPAGFLLILLCLFAPTVCAQAQAPQPQSSPRMMAANELLKAQRWTEAANAYEEIVKDEPKNGRAWYQLGMARFSLKKFALAVEAFQKNIALTNNPNVMYQLACAYARLGQNELALEWLSKAVNNKLPPIVSLADDKDLAGLRDDRRFKELATAMDQQRRPCIYSAEARQFDFWIGEWDVLNLQGQRAGKSVIQQVSGGCGVLENWTDAFGNEGKSVNFYDANTKKWHQYWIGTRGGPLRFSGVYKDNAMRYEGEPATVNGSMTLSRMTFFNLDANTVRQFVEQSIDDGKTWTVTYDFKYVRKTT
jgi:tetratricopeptide (TPR) repeat protein